MFNHNWINHPNVNNNRLNLQSCVFTCHLSLYNKSLSLSNVSLYLVLDHKCPSLMSLFLHSSSDKLMFKTALRILIFVSNMLQLCQFYTIIYQVPQGDIPRSPTRKDRKLIIYSLGAVGPSSSVSAAPQSTTDQPHRARSLVGRKREPMVHWGV